MTGFPEWLDTVMAEKAVSSDAALARIIGVSQPSIGRWRAGSTPQPEQLQKLAAALHLNVLTTFVAAGLLTAEQAQLTEVPQPIESIPPAEFAQETVRRLTGGVGHRPVGDLRTRSGKAKRDADIEFREDQVLAARTDPDKPDPDK